MTQPISSIMQKTVTSVGMDATVAEVEMMLTHNTHHVVVVENGSIKGIVSSLDYVKLFAEQNKP